MFTEQNVTYVSVYICIYASLPLTVLFFRHFHFIY